VRVVIWYAAVFIRSGRSLEGRDSSVGIATRYGLDGQGIESRWGARFSAPVQTGPGAHPASYKMGTGSSLGVKRPRRGKPTPPSAEAKEGVELYLYSPSGPLEPVLRLDYVHMRYAKEKHLADSYVRHLLGRGLRENIKTEKITNTLKIMKMANIICNSQPRWEKMLS